MISNAIFFPSYEYYVYVIDTVSRSLYAINKKKIQKSLPAVKGRKFLAPPLTRIGGVYGEKEKGKKKIAKFGSAYVYTTHTNMRYPSG